MWHPDGPNSAFEQKPGILAHHEVLLRLDAMDLDRGNLSSSPFLPSAFNDPRIGAKVAGHRGYFLTNDGVDLNQALISYSLDFLRNKGYKKIQPPFFMNKDVMAKTAQLDQFDEELYKVYLPSSLRSADSLFHSRSSAKMKSTSLPPPNNPFPRFIRMSGLRVQRNSSRLSMLDIPLVSVKKPDPLVEICGVSFVSISLKRSNNSV
jgi:seryl-tRNA synthetase